MCKCPRINYNTINIIVISFLKLIYNCTLMVALEYLNFNIKEDAVDIQDKSIDRLLDAAEKDQQQ